MMIINHSGTIYSTNEGYDRVSLGAKIGADEIFTYDSLNGITHYYKDRSRKYYQYTSEEMLILTLKAIPI
jgi:hypothetical protein